MNKPFTYQEFKRIYSQVPRLSVDVLIQTPKGIVLTLRTIEPCVGQWHIPGGTVYYGERLEAAARRLARDETGLEVTVGRMLGYIEYVSEPEWGTFTRTVSLVFLAHVDGGKLQGGPDGRDARIFSELPEKVISDQLRFLESIRLPAPA